MCQEKPHRNNLSLRLVPWKLLVILFIYLQSFPSLGMANTQANIIIINLNENWSLIPTGGNPIDIDVPCFYVWNPFLGTLGNSSDGMWEELTGVSESSYKKTFTISNQFSGKRVFLYFEAVNFVTDIYLNDQYITSHQGGFVPFEVEITPYIMIPSTNTIRVDIRYDNRLIDPDSERPFWPCGWFGQNYYMGIIGDVKLIGRTPLNIEWGYIKTSVQEEKIIIDASVQNVEEIDHDAVISIQILHDGFPLFIAGSKQIHIDSLTDTVITIEKEWQDPVYWSPKNPYLYEAVISLYKLNTKIDEKTIRFGFREFWIEDNYFILNGIRQNLRGDNIVLQGEKIYWKYFIPKSTENSWATIIDSMSALHFNVVRLHQEPVPTWMLDLCDEKGMMVIAESAIYSNAPLRSWQYTNNSVNWLQDWVIRDRNHPSIIIWSVANELTHNRKLSNEQIKLFGKIVAHVDPTRPYVYEGDLDMEGQSGIYSHHYMLGVPNSIIYKNWPPGSIYDKLSPYVRSDKPTSWGEFDWYKSGTIYQDDWIKLQCIKLRAGRILNVADIRPYRLDWAWHPVKPFFEIYDGWYPSKEQIQFLKNSMNPVAIFDKAYYENHYQPDILTFNEGTQVERDYVIFNDETGNTTIDIRFDIFVDGNVVDSNQVSVTVPLGTSIENKMGFMVPYVPNTQNFTLRLSTLKNGILKYSEDYLFKSEDTGICPPQQVTDLTIELSNQHIALSWTPVTQNMNNQSTTIDHYILYISTQYDFKNHVVDSVAGITEPPFIDLTNQYSGNSAINFFFGLKAVDHTDHYSKLSNVVAEFDFQLLTTNKTNYNAIALPLHISGIEDAHELMGVIPGCKSVGRWNGFTQSYDQYSPIIPPTLFDVQSGFPYYVYMDNSDVLTFTGKPIFPTFQLWKNENTSSFHEIMLPLNYSHISLASELCYEIDHCNSVAYWDAENQGFVQFSTDIPTINNFNMQIGYPYHVHVTENVIWPAGGFIKINQPDRKAGQILAKIQAPHMVWGRIYRTSDDQGLGFQAWITGQENETLSEKSVGCILDKEAWIVQCSSFGSGWKAGDSLFVQFLNHSDTVKVIKTVLSFDAADQAPDLFLDNQNFVPVNWFLSQNYPNPFNPDTRIELHIPKPDWISVDLYNILGQKVRTLIEGWRETGCYTIQWDGKDGFNRFVSSGTYILQLRTESVLIQRKILILQ